jgi:hypothetical protein
MKNRKPKAGEFWWADSPDEGIEPVEIVKISDNGDHQLLVLGSDRGRYANQWSLIRPIAGRPRS